MTQNILHMDGAMVVPIGYVKHFSHIIRFKVHPNVKDTFRSPEPTVAMPDVHSLALAAA